MRLSRGVAGGEIRRDQASSGARPFRRAALAQASLSPGGVASALAQASPRGAPAQEAEIRARFQLYFTNHFSLRKVSIQYR